GAALDGGLGVKGDAIVATRRDRDRERDQLFRLHVECARRKRGLRDSREALHHVACAAAQMAQFAAEIFGESGPVVCSHVSLLSSMSEPLGRPVLQASRIPPTTTSKFAIRNDPFTSTPAGRSALNSGRSPTS